MFACRKQYVCSLLMHLPSIVVVLCNNDDVNRVVVVGASDV